MMSTTVVVMGGAPTTQLLPPDVDREHDRFIAADSGLDLAERLGWRCDLVVGDLDSVSAGALERALADGTTVESAPTDKDETDLELALRRAVSEGCERIVAVGGEGGRLDHLLANIGALCSPALDGVSVEAWVGTAFVAVVRGPDTYEFDAPIGALVSLLAMHGDVVGVTTTGLRWSLGNEVLPAGSCRGLSNEVVGCPISIGVESGTLAVLVPDAVDMAGGMS